MPEEEPTLNNTLISIIIPTFNDWERLSLCLYALDDQTLEKSRYEIIIVNNDENHFVPDRIRQLTGKHIKILHEPMPGSYAARNAGLKVANGNIIGFTDSDCVPDPKWLENASKYFENVDVDRLAGKVELFFGHNNKRNAAELYEIAFSFDQERNVKKFHASITANFFTRRKYFDEVGLFDATKKSGEDFGWNRRAHAHDLTLSYGPEVVVRHPARGSIQELIRKRKRVFGGKKSRFDFKSVKGFFKEVRYPAVVFYMYLYIPIRRLSKVNLRLTEKWKVLLLIFYLYLVAQFEHIRLLFGGNPKR